MPIISDLCEFCRNLDHRQHFSAGCVEQVPVLGDCQCDVVTEQQTLLAEYEARLVALSPELIRGTLAALESLELEHVNAFRSRPDSTAKAELFAVWLDRFRETTKPVVQALTKARKP